MNGNIEGNFEGNCSFHTDQSTTYQVCRPPGQPYLELRCTQAVQVAVQCLQAGNDAAWHMLPTLIQSWQYCQLKDSLPTDLQQAGVQLKVVQMKNALCHSKPVLQTSKRLCARMPDIMVLGTC